MTPPPVNTDPSIVFKMLGGFLIIASVSLIGLAFILKLEMKWYHVVMVAMPLIGSFVMLFDSWREGVLKLADKLPFVNYTQGGK